MKREISSTRRRRENWTSVFPQCSLCSGFFRGGLRGDGGTAAMVCGPARSENFGLALASDTEAYAGRVGKARELTQRAVDSAVRADSKENGAILAANAALQQAAYGNSAERDRFCGTGFESCSYQSGRRERSRASICHGGRYGKSRSLAQDLGKRFPLDTQMQSLWLPAIRAQSGAGQERTRLAL